MQWHTYWSMGTLLPVRADSLGEERCRTFARGIRLGKYQGICAEYCLAVFERRRRSVQCTVETETRADGKEGAAGGRSTQTCEVVLVTYCRTDGCGAKGK